MRSQPSDSKSTSNPQPFNEEPNTNLRGTHIKSVPKWDANASAPEDTSDQNTVPESIRGLTLDYLDDIVGETKESPFAPTSSNKFVFFNQTDLPVTSFLNHVVHGDYEEVKAMLDKNPSLVLYKGQITDYSGRTFEGTGLKIALWAEDVSREGHPNEGMADMIRGYFIKALGNDENKADEEIRKQCMEQFPKDEFPEYYESDEKKREEIIKQKEAADPDIEALETVAKAIASADAKEIKATLTDKKDEYNNDKYELKVTGKCAKALEVFRDYLKPQGVIKKGKYKAQLLIKALEKYVGEQYDLFGGHWNDPKNLLFWCQVIGYIQRYLPANLAQALCQGLYNLTEYAYSLKRKKLVDGSFFFPKDVSAWRLGFDFAEDSGSGGVLRWEGVTDSWRGGVVGACYETYVMQKQQSFVCLCGMLKTGVKDELSMFDTVDCRRNNKP